MASSEVSSDWELAAGLALPQQKVALPRANDFRRFAELQLMLRASVTCMLEFTKRDFQAIREVAPEFQTTCEELQSTSKPLLDLSAYAHGMESLVQRIKAKEKLRIIFIGPLKAGKSTLINMLLTAHLPELEMLVPVDNKAATNCIWKVESTSGSCAEVFLNEQLQRRWPLEGLDPHVVRRDLAEYLEEHFARDARPFNRGEICILLPLELLDPFGCHYSLVDTPGFTESAEYQSLVAKFLEDHSHIACMVCPLTEGTALPKDTQRMMKLNSYSKTFWVLSRFDLALGMNPSKKQQKVTKRQAADSLVTKFQRDILGHSSGGRIFRHAGGLLMDPEDDQNQVLQKYLPLQEAQGWLKEIRHHVKQIFLELQQEQTVLSSQAQRALVRTAELTDEYTKRLNTSPGTVAASDYYAQEMQAAADEAAEHLEREIKQEIDTVRDQQLQELCKQAGDQVREEGGSARWVRHVYMKSLLAALVPKIERELHVRLEECMQRAQERILLVALRLLQEAGLERSGSAECVSRSEIMCPGTDHLRANYPVESAAMLTFTALTVGRLAATEGGLAALGAAGFTFTSLQLAGLVGVAIGGIWALGLSMKYALELHPLWTYGTAEEEVVQEIRRTNHWSILSQVAFARGKNHLLSNAARFRYKFSELLLTRGASMDALHSLFPDLPLLERIRQKLSDCCKDIQDFTDAEPLKDKAVMDRMDCVAFADAKDWRQVVSRTEPYVAENARTDVVDGAVLANLLALRTEALVKSDRLRDAKHSVEVFRKLFPALVLPLAYEVAVQVLLEFLEGTKEERTQTRVRFCNAELRSAEGEVPELVEVWYFGVAASFLDDQLQEEAWKRLLEAVGRFMRLRLAQVPCWDRIVSRHMSLASEICGDEAAMKNQEEMKRVFEEECRSFVEGMTLAVQNLLDALSPQQLDMKTLAQPILKHVVATAQSMLDPDLCQSLLARLPPKGLEKEWEEVFLQVLPSE
ncbi:unnamed protein product [Effrenium voratum]|uniref:Dynamin N-terminal domain-containing protein n=1 Tax=Effrenium voratum TaxID=2562239 RepID=A0AA36IPJ7_9DINO|nr:unnamed protein product [Effrenium voratum]